MRKTIIAVFICALCAFIASSQQEGQSGNWLVDNSYLKEAADYKAKADAAYEAGDYDAATNYLNKMREAIAKSDEVVELAVNHSKVEKLLAAADARIAEIGAKNSSRVYKDDFDAATVALEKAHYDFDSMEYDSAQKGVEAANAYMDKIKEGFIFPKNYTVLLIVDKRDCLYRIAARPGVYGDPAKWRPIYEANKDAFVDPKNPHLILPGQKLVIPSIAGETREGDWDKSVSYPPLPSPVTK